MEQNSTQSSCEGVCYASWTCHHPSSNRAANFQLFFTTAVVDIIVRETNIYAHQVLGDAAGEKWEDVTAGDIRAFLGFALLMGINRLPQIHLYWNQQLEFYYAPITERITRDRFMAIWQYLHFTSNPPPCSQSSSSSLSVSSSSPPQCHRHHPRHCHHHPCHRHS